MATRRRNGKARATGRSDGGAAAAASELPGLAADLPPSLKPQLATLVDGVPRHGDDWLYEVKFDGYRMLARVEGSRVQLFTRNGHDWSAKVPHLVASIQQMHVPSAWIDGEIVVLADNGVPSFQALQNAFDGKRTSNIIFYAFDLPFIAGRDIRGEPLRLRRELLAQLVAARQDEHIRFSEAFSPSPADLVASACRMGLEGIMAKRQSARYVSSRTDDWVKIKCAQRQEFVIVGYTAPKGARVGFGALLLGVYEAAGGLRYAGSVGTGFDDRGLLDLHKKLTALNQKATPLSAGKPKSLRDVQWVAPALVCEVSFAEWTEGGHVRHATFRGLRTDKPAPAITRERALPASSVESKTKPPAPPPPTPAQRPPSMRTKSGKLSNPDRVIDPSTGLKKLDLARYYGLVAPLLVTHLKARPVSFVRAPGGIQGQLFFQKHLDAPIPGVTALPEGLHPGHPALLEVPTPAAVLSAAQMNVIESHTWNAIEKPDRLILDLDPGEGVSWPAVQQAAQLVRVLLHGLGLEGWLKTSGGKGLHVVVPLRKQYGWDVVKGFSAAMVRHLARTLPQLFVAKSGPSNRVGKIFVDYLRNGFGATTAAAWSARARPGLGVSVPLSWDELVDVTGGAQWTISNIQDRLDVGKRPVNPSLSAAVVPG